MKREAIILAINDLDFGGGQRTVVAEANELYRRGVPVHVVTTLAGARMPLRAMLRIPESQIHHVAFKSLADFSAYSKLFQLMRAINPYAVVSNLFFTNTVVRIAAFFSPVRISIREGNVPTEKGLFAKIVDLILSLRTHSIIANSGRVKDSIPFVFATKVLLYNGIGDEFFIENSERNRMRDALGIKRNEPMVLIVASVTPKKGHRYALEALSFLSPQERTLRLVIVGEGGMRTELEEYAHTLGLKEHILFLGNRTDIRELLSASDIFLLPSLWEGMPNVLLEAMAAGIPSIATNVGGVSEVVTNEEKGYLVPAQDARAIARTLSLLLQNPELRVRVGSVASRSVSHLTWEKHVTRLLEIV